MAQINQDKYHNLQYKYQRIALLKSRLASAADWAIIGCKRIYEYQTASEQAIGDTREHNNVGFSGADAEILSSFAEQINSGRFRGSEKQMNILFQKMPKYAKQLDNIAQTKIQEDTHD